MVSEEGGTHRIRDGVSLSDLFCVLGVVGRVPAAPDLSLALAKGKMALALSCA